MSNCKVYSQNNVMCAMLCVFVITFILGCISGWILHRIYGMDSEKMEIKNHMLYQKDKTDYMKVMEKFRIEQEKIQKESKAEGTMHSQDPRAGQNKIQRMNAQSGEDPDKMLVDRMTPPDLEIAQNRNDDGRDTPYDRRHIEAIANDPDEALMQSFRSSEMAMTSTNWS